MSTLLSFRYRYKPGREQPPASFSALQVSTWHKVRAMLRRPGALVPNPCLCGADRSALIAEMERHQLAMPHFLCPACGIIRQDPVMAPEIMREFYRTCFRDLCENRETGFPTFAEEFAYRYANQSSLVYDRVREYATGGSLLDVGGAGGWTVKYFADRGFTARGIDLDERYVREGRACGAEMEEKTIDEIDGRYDVVTVDNVLEHVRDVRPFLARLAGLVRDGGYVFISLPGAMGFEAERPYAGCLMDTLQIAHPWLFTLSNLRATVESATGLRLVWGTERIDAIFRKDAAAGTPTVTAPGQARAVRRYLQQHEPSRLRLMWRRLRRKYSRC